MRRLLLLTPLLALFAGVSVAEEADMPAVDLSPIHCVWVRLPTFEQAALRNTFKAGKGKIYNAVAAADAASRYSEECKLNYSSEQARQLGSALGAKAVEEEARAGVAKRKAIDVALIDASIAKLDPDRRIVIGNAITCDGAEIERTWDRSLRKGMTRAGIRSVDGVSVALVAAAMLYVLKQEGHMRRINGELLEPCPPAEPGDD
jgi:hypothetical protein